MVINDTRIHVVYVMKGTARQISIFSAQFTFRCFELYNIQKKCFEKIVNENICLMFASQKPFRRIFQQIRAKNWCHFELIFKNEFHKNSNWLIKSKNYLLCLDPFRKLKLSNSRIKLQKILAKMISEFITCTSISLEFLADTNEILVSNLKKK